MSEREPAQGEGDCALQVESASSASTSVRTERPSLSHRVMLSIRPEASRQAVLPGLEASADQRPPPLLYYLAVISNDVVHSGLLGKNGRYHTFHSVREGPRVKLHRNAKTTPTMRALIVHRIRQEQWPPAEAAAAAGVSVRTTYKWLRRHRLGGRPALEDASSRPHCQPRRTSPDTVAAIVAARYERRTGWAIATSLHVPRSTVAAVLVRAGLNRLARLRTTRARRSLRARAARRVGPPRYETPRAYSARRSSHPSPAAQRRRRRMGYVHVAVDDYSRAAYVEVLPDQTGATTAAFYGAPSAGLRGAASPSRAS